MKRVAAFGVILGLLLMLQAGVAQATISLDFVPPSQSVSLGTPVTVGLQISGLGDLVPPSLGTFDLDVSFDPTILSFSGATYGTGLDVLGLGSLQITTPGVGTVNLFELSFDSVDDLNTLQPGTFTLATLTFDTIGLGASALGFHVNALGDADGNSLSAVPGVGSITAVPEPGTMFLLGTGLMGALLFRRRR